MLILTFHSLYTVYRLYSPLQCTCTFISTQLYSNQGCFSNMPTNQRRFAYQSETFCQPIRFLFATKYASFPPTNQHCSCYANQSAVLLLYQSISNQVALCFAPIIHQHYANQVELFYYSANQSALCCTLLNQPKRW